MQPSAVTKNNILAVMLQKDMVLVLAAIFLVYMNLFNSLTILPLYVLSLGGSDFQAGLHSAIFSLAAVILRFLLGPLADLRGRKLLLLVGSFVFGSSSLLIWLAPDLSWVAIARVYQAIGMATFLSTGSSVVADLTPGEFRGSVMGLYRLVVVMAFMFGPSCGLNIVNKYGYNAYFWFNAVICFVALGILCFLGSENKGSSQSSASIFGNIILLFKNSYLLMAYAGVAAIASSYGIILTYVTIFAGRLGIGNPGLFFTLFAGVGGVAGILGGFASDKWGRARVVWPAISILGIGLVAISLLPQFSAGVFYFGAICAGIGFYGGLPNLIAWVVDTVDENMVATALALQENALDGSFAVSAFLFGVATDFAEYTTLFLIWGVIGIFSPFLIAQISKTKID